MYTLRIPFLVPPATRIGIDEVRVEAGGLNLSLKTAGRYHVLTVDGFASEPDAIQFIDGVPAALTNLLLERGMAAEASICLQHVQYQPDPNKTAKNLSESLGVEISGPVDGLINGSEAAVYLTEKRLRILTGGQASIYTTVPADQVLNVLAAGIRLPGAAQLLGDPKLMTAMKLYGAYFTEQSGTAKFLTLIMALEALAESTRKSQFALDLLERWDSETTTLLESIPEGSEDAESLDALRRELFFRRDDSIRSQIRKLVAKELANEADPLVQSRNAVRLYDLRSTLVHKGHLEINQLSQATADAKELVQRVLTVRFRNLTAFKGRNPHL